MQPALDTPEPHPIVLALYALAGTLFFVSLGALVAACAL